jgi:hypothetical protein
MMLNSPMSFQRASGEDFQDDVDGIDHLKERTSGPDFGRGTRLDGPIEQTVRLDT